MTQEKAQSNSDAAWISMEAERVRVKLIQEGVSEGRAEVIKNIFTSKVKKGVPPGYAERHIQPEVLQAKRASEIDRLGANLAARFHLPVEQVELIVARDVRRLRENPRLLVQLVIQKHEAKLTKLSREAYNNRRASKSTMAAALVRSRTTEA